MARALLVAGPPASGKSNLGCALGRRLRLAVLDQDVLTNPLVAVVADLVGAGDDLDHARLRDLVREARYEALLDSAALQLRCSTGVVLVAPFTTETQDEDRWAAVQHRLRGAGASSVHLVWLHAPPALLQRRLRLRSAPRDRARLGDPLLLQAWVDGVRPPVVPAVTVDASLTRSRQVEAVVTALGLT